MTRMVVEAVEAAAVVHLRLVLEWARLMNWIVFGTTHQSLTNINTEAVGTIDLKHRRPGLAALVLRGRLHGQKSFL